MCSSDLAPSNRAAFPRPGVDGGTGGQSPSINIATPKPRRATGRRFLALASMATGGQFRSRQSRIGQPGGVSSPWRRWRHQRPISQHQYRHAKAEPGNRAAFPRPSVDGGTCGQSPSINIATPKPSRATGRRFLALASMATGGQSSGINAVEPKRHQ